MSKHLRIYDKFFDIDVHNPRRCELTGGRRPKVEVHHIDARGMGGNKKKDNIENCMALISTAHNYFGDKVQYKDWLRENHELYMMDQVPLLERDPLDEILLKFITDCFGSLKI